VGTEKAGKGYNNDMKRVAITTLGCKTNQFESAAMCEKFEKSGYTMVPFSTEADIYIINSCTVTARTDAETRRLIRRARRLNPTARVVATGCYAQVAPDQLECLPEVDSVIGNREKQDIIALVESGKSRVSDIAASQDHEPLQLETFAEHTRAFLQAQNGCNSFCSYCIVPFARGRSRSARPADVLQGIRDLASNGYKEVVLTGIHLGAYGLDLTPSTSLTELIRMIDTGQLVKRLRIGSVEPNEVSDELLGLMGGSDIICPHLHLPLQSGSDPVLKRMGRGYTADFFRKLMSRIMAVVPHAFIGADVIAGFPGESEDEFEETRQLVEELPFSDLHVFPYSKRPGTKAAELPDQVPPKVIKTRAGILRAIADQKKNSFLESQLGRQLEVLVQGHNSSNGVCRGISRNYVNVIFPAQTGETNIERTILATGAERNHVTGIAV
jgi:threonylcarbamoyladenosine tRNA methylthiotransferase MtaB